MDWLFIAIGSYVLLALSALIDKFLLSGKLDDPKIYAFYIGLLSSAGIILLPFGFWSYPDPQLFFLGVAAGMAQIYGCFFYLSALKRLEASRVLPVVGSLIPIIGFFLTAAVSGGAAVLGQKELVGFLLLIAGSWLIMARGINFKKRGLGFIFIAAFLFALNVVLAKLVYIRLPFLNGFLLTAFGSAAAAVTFLPAQSVRHAVFESHKAKDRGQPNLLFFFGQAAGGIAFLLQSLAVARAPQASVPVVNAMAGVQYVFIFIFSSILSFHFPKHFKEKINSSLLVQKLAAIFLIGIGLAIFALQ